MISAQSMHLRNNTRRLFHEHIFARICGTRFCCSSCLRLFRHRQPQQPVSMSLHDEESSFSDAQPLMRNDRTFVPFLIFESMGAGFHGMIPLIQLQPVVEIGTIKLTIGRKACVVDRAGSDRSFTTDAAPFIEGGRTYVPVRFAAQALGAAVGRRMQPRPLSLVLKK